MSVSGTGSQEDPHIVTTWADFTAQTLAAGTSSATHYIKLGADLDLKDINLDGLYLPIANYIDLDGDGHKLSNWSCISNWSYGELFYIGSLTTKMHDIIIENLNYVNTSTTQTLYGIFVAPDVSSSSELGKGGFENIKVSGKLIYTVAPLLILGAGYFNNNSFNFEYYAPQLPTRGFIGSTNTYANHKNRNELRYKAYLSSSISGILWADVGAYSATYQHFYNNSLLAEINALEGCNTTTPPRLFYNGSDYGYPVDCYCVVKSNVSGLTIPASTLAWIKPSRLLYQKDGDNIAAISSEGINSSFASQFIGCTAAQLKNSAYLTSIGFENVEVS